MWAASLLSTVLALLFCQDVCAVQNTQHQAWARRGAALEAAAPQADHVSLAQVLRRGLHRAAAPAVLDEAPAPAHATLAPLPAPTLAQVPAPYPAPAAPSQSALVKEPAPAPTVLQPTQAPAANQSAEPAAPEAEGVSTGDPFELNATEKASSPYSIVPKIVINDTAPSPLMRPLANATVNLTVTANATNNATLNCVVSEWSGWTNCAHVKGSGHNAAQQDRIRQVVNPHVEGGTPCPALMESRVCKDAGPLARGVQQTVVLPR
mmetsp:Transcript_16135/g.41771  ORF Transcript_16135/g.41771 Transcript_16135/m.41771 type:complete len:264 (+) Transcript_16135:123-914(+)